MGLTVPLYLSPAIGSNAFITTTGPAAAEKLGERWDAAEQHGRAYMLGSNVSINTLPAAEVERFHATLTPMVKQAVEAVDKAGKPGTAFLAAYEH